MITKCAECQHAHLCKYQENFEAACKDLEETVKKHNKAYFSINVTCDYLKLTSEKIKRCSNAPWGNNNAGT